MQVSKWGASLAVRLPKKLVAQMGLKAGDELELTPAEPGRLNVRKLDSATEFLEKIRAFNWELPPDYRFNRDEANER